MLAVVQFKTNRLSLNDKNLNIKICNTIIIADLGTFAKLRKASSCLSVLLTLFPSVHMEQIGYHRADFHEILFLNICLKSVKKIKISLKYDRING
jgi:hypothetical protein